MQSKQYTPPDTVYLDNRAAIGFSLAFFGCILGENMLNQLQSVPKKTIEILAGKKFTIVGDQSIGLNRYKDSKFYQENIALILEPRNAITCNKATTF